MWSYGSVAFACPRGADAMPTISAAVMPAARRQGCMKPSGAIVCHVSETGAQAVGWSGFSRLLARRQDGLDGRLVLPGRVTELPLAGELAVHLRLIDGRRDRVLIGAIDDGAVDLL